MNTTRKRVADRPERDREPDDGEDRRAACERGARARCGAPPDLLHGAEGYGGERLDRLRSTRLAARTANGGTVTLKHPKAPGTRAARPRGRAALQPRDTDDPAPLAAGRRDAARRRVPDHPRRAHARRQRAPQRRHVRLHVDGASGREAHGRVLRQEHDRQGRVPADRGDRGAVRQHPRQPLARA